MSDSDETTQGAPDGSTDVTEEQKEYTEELGDGTRTGDATEDPNQDSDVTSGGDPDGQ